MNYRTIARRLAALEQAQKRVARQVPVREIILHVPAEVASTREAYTLWTAPGVEASHPRWVSPYDERRDRT